MEVSYETYEEIRSRLLEAGYTQAIQESGAFERIDMHGIALRSELRSKEEDI
jgi:hypothetical protein